jgi:hypothetical protein
MAVSRIAKNLGFSVPPRMTAEFELIAAEEGSTKSEVFRRMFRRALAGHADLIVTGDKDLLRLKEYRGIPIMHTLVNDQKTGQLNQGSKSITVQPGSQHRPSAPGTLRCRTVW